MFGATVGTGTGKIDDHGYHEPGKWDVHVTTNLLHRFESGTLLDPEYGEELEAIHVEQCQ